MLVDALTQMWDLRLGLAGLCECLNSCGQQFVIQMETSEEHCSSRIGIGIVIFVDAMDKKTECTPRNSAGDTELNCAFDTSKGLNAIQTDLNNLETQAYVNLMKFYKAKCLSSLIFSSNMYLKLKDMCLEI